MKTTKFEIKNRKLDKIDFERYTGNFNVDTFNFEFDEEWDNLEKTLVIIIGDKTYNVSILNNEAILPLEAYTGNTEITIGVFGKNEDTILSSNLIGIWMTKGAYIEGKEPENLPTPTQWDLYIEEINNLLDNAKLSEEECKRVLEEIEIAKREINDTVNNFAKNAEEKTNDFDTHVAEKMKEFEEFSEGITVITSGTDDLVDGESILPAGSMHLVYAEIKDETEKEVT